MSAKEKAARLVMKFYSPESNVFKAKAKECALITVNEILHILFQHHEIDYWKEVVTEIEKL